MERLSKPKVFLSVINDLSGDQRIARVANTLVEEGYQVRVLGRKLSHSRDLPPTSYETHRMRLLFTRGKLFYLEFNLRLFFYLLFRPIDVLHANDLDTLLANFLVSRIRRIPLVYDSHEYFTQVPELLDRPRTQWVWEQLEKRLFPRLLYVFTVNQQIADIYTEKYGTQVEVLRNLPSRKENLGVATQSPSNILLYQGALNVGRGIELMIEAMAFLPQYTLWIIGKGDVEKQLKSLAEKEPHPERIVFKGFIPFGDLYPYTKQAIIGFSLEEDRGMNYRFASPNKVYDYIQAGVPVIVSDLPEMKRIVQQHGVGEVLKSTRRTPRGLASQVLAVLSDEETYMGYRQACVEAAEELTWENERMKLVKLYERIGN